MSTYLDFEKPIADLEGKIAELRHQGSGDSEGIDIADEVGKLQAKVDRQIRATYSKLTAWQRVQVARHPERPHAKHYIAGLVEEAETQVRVVVNELGRWDLPRRDISPFVTGMRLCYANARKVLKRGLAKEDVAQLHEARKSLIHFRHQLEMVAPLWPSVLKAWADDLQDLREVLGDLGDLEELDCVLGSPICADLPEAFRKTIADLLAARRADLLEKVKPPSNRLFAEKPVVLEKRLEALWMAALRDRRRKAGVQIACRR